MSQSESRDETQSNRELLASFALGEGGDVEDMQCLAELLKQSKWQREYLELEVTASAVLLQHSPGGYQPLPDSLRKSLMESAEAFFANDEKTRDQANHGSMLTSEAAVRTHTEHSKTHTEHNEKEYNEKEYNEKDQLPALGGAFAKSNDGSLDIHEPHRTEANTRVQSWLSPRETIAWLVAAASLLIAVALWGLPKTSPTSLTQLRMELIEKDPQAVTVSWSTGPTPAAADVSGDVVWSGERQSGYMRFVGLPINDPSVEQYQLWIFDRERNEKYPVDGGVFNVSESGEVIIPINAKLPVQTPTLFAITVEQAGGVVVSSRERLPLLAAVGQ